MPEMILNLICRQSVFREDRTAGMLKRVHVRFVRLDPGLAHNTSS
jgi:hypothetical protein